MKPFQILSVIKKISGNKIIFEDEDLDMLNSVNYVSDMVTGISDIKNGGPIGNAIIKYGMQGNGREYLSSIKSEAPQYIENISAAILTYIYCICVGNNSRVSFGTQYGGNVYIDDNNDKVFNDVFNRVLSSKNMSLSPSDLYIEYATYGSKAMRALYAIYKTKNIGGSTQHATDTLMWLNILKYSLASVSKSKNNRLIKLEESYREMRSEYSKKFLAIKNSEYNNMVERANKSEYDSSSDEVIEASIRGVVKAIIDGNALGLSDEGMHIASSIANNIGKEQYRGVLNSGIDQYISIHSIENGKMSKSSAISYYLIKIITTICNIPAISKDDKDKIVSSSGAIHQNILNEAFEHAIKSMDLKFVPNIDSTDKEILDRLGKNDDYTVELLRGIGIPSVVIDEYTNLIAIRDSNPESSGGSLKPNNMLIVYLGINGRCSIHSDVIVNGISISTYVGLDKNIKWDGKVSMLINGAKVDITQDDISRIWLYTDRQMLVADDKAISIISGLGERIDKKIIKDNSMDIEQSSNKVAEYIFKTIKYTEGNVPGWAAFVWPMYRNDEILGSLQKLFTDIYPPDNAKRELDSRITAVDEAGRNYRAAIRQFIADIMTEYTKKPPDLVTIDDIEKAIKDPTIANSSIKATEKSSEKILRIYKQSGGPGRINIDYIKAYMSKYGIGKSLFEMLGGDISKYPRLGIEEYKKAMESIINMRNIIKEYDDTMLSGDAIRDELASKIYRASIISDMKTFEKIRQISPEYRELFDRINEINNKIQEGE